MGQGSSRGVGTTLRGMTARNPPPAPPLQIDCAQGWVILDSTL